GSAVSCASAASSGVRDGGRSHPPHRSPSNRSGRPSPSQSTTQGFTRTPQSAGPRALSSRHADGLGGTSTRAAASRGSRAVPSLRNQTTLPSPAPTIRSGLPSPSQSATTGAASPCSIRIGFPPATSGLGSPNAGFSPVPTFRTRNTSPLTVPTIRSGLPSPFQSNANGADAEPTLSGLPADVFSCSPAAKLPSAS